MHVMDSVQQAALTMVLRVKYDDDDDDDADAEQMLFTVLIYRHSSGSWERTKTYDED